jgi:hypothetical protein
MATAGAGTCRDFAVAVRPADTSDPPPYLLATKLEAWSGRGGGDHLRSHDLEDVIRLVDGRAEVVAEVGDSSDDLRSFLAREITTLLDQPRFLDAIDGTVVGLGRGSSGDGDRIEEIVMPCLRTLAEG